MKSLKFFIVLNFAQKYKKCEGCATYKKINVIKIIRLLNMNNLDGILKLYTLILNFNVK
jgi:hypothetical protein